MFNLIAALICAVGLGVAIERRMPIWAAVQTIFTVANAYYAVHILMGGL